MSKLAGFQYLRTYHTAKLYARKDAAPTAPVVVLLGWMGGRWKHLQKYSCLYEPSTYNVIAATATMRSSFMPWKYTAIAQELLTLLEGHAHDKQDVYIHALSNGGGFVAAQLMEALEGHRRLHFRGLILDSAPSRLQLIPAANALMTTMLASTPRGLLARWAIRSIALLIIPCIKFMVCPSREVRVKSI